MKIPFFTPKPTKGDGESTAAPSSNPSQSEKDVLPTSQNPSFHPQNGEQKIETTALGEAEALDKLNEENEYPHGAKLAIITASLCISVLLMALVSSTPLADIEFGATLMSGRTIQLSPLLFQR